MSSSPIWQAWYPGPVCRYVTATDLETARRVAHRRWSELPQRVVYAGYAADERQVSLRPKGLARKRELRQRQRELAYAAVSVTSTADPQPERVGLARRALCVYAVLREWPTGTSIADRRVSQAALRSYCADVGAAIERCPRVVRDQIHAWLAGESRHVELVALNAILTGDTEDDLLAALRFAFAIMDVGIAADEALELADRCRTVRVPAV